MRFGLADTALTEAENRIPTTIKSLNAEFTSDIPCRNTPDHPMNLGSAGRLTCQTIKGKSQR
jgi:hypothetical protein